MKSEKLVIEHLDLVRRIAGTLYQRMRGAVGFEELVAMGNEGLVQAASRYCPNRHNSFASFARFRIHGAMIDGVAKIGQFSRRQYKRNIEQKEALESATLIDKKSQPIVIEELPGAIKPPIAQELTGALTTALCALSSKERYLILNHYFQGKSLKECADELGLSKSWASRMHSRALVKLKSYLQTNNGTVCYLVA